MSARAILVSLLLVAAGVIIWAVATSPLEQEPVASQPSDGRGDADARSTPAAPDERDGARGGRVALAPDATGGTRALAATPQPDVVAADVEDEATVIERVNVAFEAWIGAAENRGADVTSHGVDCRPPVCMLGVTFDSGGDGAFFNRSREWLSAQGIGQVTAFPHRLDATHLRVWYFWNPHAEGTPEHHQFNEAAVARIVDDRKGTPDYYPAYP